MGQPSTERCKKAQWRKNPVDHVLPVWWVLYGWRGAMVLQIATNSPEHHGHLDPEVPKQHGTLGIQPCHTGSQWREDVFTWNRAH